MGTTIESRRIAVVGISFDPRVTTVEMGRWTWIWDCKGEGGIIRRR
jgi:hypothetical protein